MTEPATGTQDVSQLYYGDPVSQALHNAIHNAPTEEPQVETEEEVPEVEVETPAEEVPEVEEEKSEEEKSDEPEKETEDESDEDEIPDSDEEYPTEEQLLASLPRSVPKKFIAQAAEWSQEAKDLNEKIDSIGGEVFIKPLSDMVTALKDESDDPNSFIPFMTAVTEAGGEDALLKMLSQSMYVGLIAAPEWSKKPETKAFGEELLRRGDAFLNMRYGVDTKELNSLVDFGKVGWPEKIADWSKRYAEDSTDTTIYDEFEEFMQLGADPKQRKVLEENRELKRQLEEKAVPEKAEDKNFEQGFSDFISENVDKVVDNVILKNSPLTPRENDTDELKEQKQWFRDVIAQQMLASINKSSNRQSLLDGFKVGKQRTSVYQSNLMVALSDAVSATSKDKLRGEQIVASMYGKTRNAKLVTKPVEKPVVPAVPTVPTDFKPAPDGKKSIHQIDKELAEALNHAGI